MKHLLPLVFGIYLTLDLSYNFSADPVYDEHDVISSGTLWTDSCFGKNDLECGYSGSLTTDNYKKYYPYDNYIYIRKTFSIKE